MNDSTELPPAASRIPTYHNGLEFQATSDLMARGSVDGRFGWKADIAGAKHLQ